MDGAGTVLQGEGRDEGAWDIPEKWGAGLLQATGGNSTGEEGRTRELRHDALR